MLRHAAIIHRTCLVMVALERWFTELGVGWVVHVASSSGELGNTTTSTFDTWSWIRALAEIMETIRLTTSLSPVHGLVGMPSEEPPAETGKQATSNSPDQLKFVQFFHGTMLKMLVFVDVLVREVVVTKGVPVPYMKLSNPARCARCSVQGAIGDLVAVPFATLYTS